MVLIAACGVERTVGSVPQPWAEPEETLEVPNQEPDEVPNENESPIDTNDECVHNSPDDATCEDETPEEPVPGIAPCDIAWGLFSQCEPPPQGCESPAVGECILEIGPAVGGYCTVVESGHCQGGQVTTAAEEYCQIQACLGVDYHACIAELATTCVSDTCDDLNNAVGHCPGYDYACAEAPTAEAHCLLNVFEAVSQPCALFVDSPQCAAGLVTETGWGSCHIQACLNLTTFDACLGNLEILCSFTAP